jgi:hypothetical protein
MTFEEFDKLIGRIFTFFASDLPNQAQRDQWFAEVKRIPASAIPAIWSEFKTRDGVSRRSNIPKIMGEIHQKAAGVASPESGIAVYNVDEDLRFPVALMVKAFNILEREGYPAYAAYSQAVRMPKSDRDRVENKFRVVRAAEGFPAIPEIGTRINQKIDRPERLPYREPGE